MIWVNPSVGEGKRFFDRIKKTFTLPYQDFATPTKKLVLPSENDTTQSGEIML